MAGKFSWRWKISSTFTSVDNCICVFLLTSVLLVGIERDFWKDWVIHTMNNGPSRITIVSLKTQWIRISSEWVKSLNDYELRKQGLSCPMFESYYITTKLRAKRKLLNCSYLQSRGQLQDFSLFTKSSAVRRIKTLKNIKETSGTCSSSPDELPSGDSTFNEPPINYNSFRKFLDVTWIEHNPYTSSHSLWR